MERNMKKWKKDFCLLCMVASLIFMGPLTLQAQDFPQKPITAIAASAVGGQAEMMCRTLAIVTEEKGIFGQPLLVQAKPGGGGAVGVEYVYGAKPDGYTLLAGKANWSSILPALEGRSRGPDEMEPICRINTAYAFLFVQASSPFKTLKDLIAYAKANPDKLSFGNSGAWSMVDLEWRWLEMKASIKTRNVNCLGGGEAILRLLGGHVMCAAFSPGAGIPQVRAGKIRALAFSGRKRHPALPDVPTFIEEGYDDGLDGNWHGFMAPKGTPRPIIEKLAAGFKKATEHPKAIEAFDKLGEEFGYMGTEEFAKFWRKDFEIYKEMAKMFKK